jgi:SAM-dependent methyltransferase
VSYDPRRRGLAAEVDRLEAQAAIAWPAERDLLRSLGVGGAILEVGSGSGAFLQRLRELGDVTGVEPDAELRAASGAVAGTAEALPFADATFDAVVLRYVFQHLPDPAAAAQEAARVLKPGGVLVAIEVDGPTWGIAHPTFPEAAAVHAKIWRAQPGRMIGRRLPALFAAAGLARTRLDLYSYSSYDHGLDAFDAHLHPDQVEPLVSADDYAVLLRAYERFRADPDAYVALIGVIVSGRLPSTNSPTVDSA